MRIPQIRGTIDRRILINYRVDPSVLAALLPPPFEPTLVRGYGMAGVCLIRLKHIRPWFAPWSFGIGSENAAHRIAVEWREDGQLREGVFIPRRDTSSRLNTLAGGRLFPGTHHHARFQVSEAADHYRITLDSDDARTHLLVEASAAETLPSTSIFRSSAEASTFFSRGSLGYSPSRVPDRYDGLELETFGWHATPLNVRQVTSSYFEDRLLFPKGSVAFDSALLMRNLEHAWHARPTIEHRRRRCVA